MTADQWTPAIRPMITHRGSSTFRARTSSSRSSSHRRCASTKSMPCFAFLARLFASSNSKSIRSAICLIWQRSRASCAWCRAMARTACREEQVMQQTIAAVIRATYVSIGREFTLVFGVLPRACGRLPSLRVDWARLGSVPQLRWFRGFLNRMWPSWRRRKPRWSPRGYAAL